MADADVTRSPVVALVTGGNQGLGLSLVRGLCRRLGENSVVYLAARDRTRGEQAVGLLEAEGLHSVLQQLDVRDEAQVQASANLISQRHGGVDIVISNAAARRDPGHSDAQDVRAFVDTNNHGAHRMIRALGPLLRDGGRFVVVASSFGSLRYLPEPLHARFDTDRMSLEDLEALMDDYASLVEAGAVAKAGWPSSVNIPSKVGQVAAVRIMARMYREEAARRGLLINAACPGLIDTDASRPWFADMSQAQSPDEAAADVVWLATLPAGTTEPYGELVQHRVVLPFRGTPLTPQNRTDA
jgi:carbonyl reductase 1